MWSVVPATPHVDGPTVTDQDQQSSRLSGSGAFCTVLRCPERLFPSDVHTDPGNEEESLNGMVAKKPCIQGLGTKAARPEVSHLEKTRLGFRFPPPLSSGNCPRDAVTSLALSPGWGT